MRSVAISIQIKVRHGRVHLKKVSWQEHIPAGHFPFRQDCRVCQEASAKDGVLSMDVRVPFKEAPDLFLGSKARYLLVATFTWPASRKGQGESEEMEECPPEAPQIEEEGAEAQRVEAIPEGEEEPPEDAEELPYKTGVERPELDVEPEPSLTRKAKQPVAMTKVNYCEEHSNTAEDREWSQHNNTGDDRGVSQDEGQGAQHEEKEKMSRLEEALQRVLEEEMTFGSHRRSNQVEAGHQEGGRRRHPADEDSVCRRGQTEPYGLDTTDPGRIGCALGPEGQSWIVPSSRVLKPNQERRRSGSSVAATMPRGIQTLSLLHQAQMRCLSA